MTAKIQLSLLLVLVFQLIIVSTQATRFRFRGDENGPPPLDPDPNKMYSEQALNTARRGLPKCLRPRNVAVIGAGVAGLTTALELSLSGHKVQVFEASGRLGGRIYTYRTPNGYITELGAMRLPLNQHKLLANYIQERFRLPTKDFQHFQEDTYIYINDVTLRQSSGILFPETFRFNVSDQEKGQTAAALWETAIKPLLNMSDATLSQLYGAYSVQLYLMEIANLSRAAVDFIGIMLNLESNMYTSIVEAVRDTQLIPDDAKFSHIDGGNDLLINALANGCRNVSNGRCSIYLNRLITQVNYHSNEQTATLKYGNVTIPDIFSDVIVATTARAANAIKFDSRSRFVNKYRALRQLHYDCASKIAHSFKTRWWEELSITGGYSITDLPVRYVYYYNFNTTSKKPNDGSIMLSSYTWSQDSLLWSGMSDEESCALALQNLNDFHANPTILSLATNCTAYHWCNDPYALGAFALFTPYQETSIHDDLGTSVGDTIHFIGEHTSLVHGWIEGAMLSSMRLLMHLQEEAFDLVIIGGGPLGLMTALTMAQKQSNFKIAIVEQFFIGNTQGSSGSTDIRQFQQAYEEWYLSDLGRLADQMWAVLENRAKLSNGSLLNKQNGYLYVDSYSTTNAIYDNCQNLSLPCTLLNPTELKYNYSFISASPNQQGVFMSSSGVINVTLLLNVLQILLDQNQNIVIRENEAYLAHELIEGAGATIFTDRGSLRASSIIFLPGPYAKNVSALLGLDLNMNLWELPTFYARRLSTASIITPAWFDDSFVGYSPESNGSLYSGYVRVEPHFLADPNRALIWPDQRTNKPDELLLNATRSWLRTHLNQMVDPNDIVVASTTCLASILPDRGYLLDYVPGDSNGKRLIMGAGGWAMKYIPVFADILTDLVLDETAGKRYAPYLDQFAFSRPGRLTPITSTTTTIFTTSTSTSISTPENKKETTYMTFMIVFLLTTIITWLILIGYYCYRLKRHNGYIRS